MSFILDALKKSENERQRHLGPSLADVRASRRAAERPWWAYAIAALLVVNLVVLVVVLLRKNDGPVPTAASSSLAIDGSAAGPASGVSAQTNQGMGAGRSVASTRGPTTGAGSAQTEALRANPAVRSLADEIDADAGTYASDGAAPWNGRPYDRYGSDRAMAGRMHGNPVNGSYVAPSGDDAAHAYEGDYGPGAASSLDPQRGYGPGAAAASIDLAAAAAVPNGPPLVRRIGPPQTTFPPGTERELRDASRPAEAGAAENEILPTLNDMRAGGTSLPDMHLDIHVHSANPAERFIFVNMRKYTEGQTLQEGPIVERIRSDGVVLNHQGLRFLLPRQ